MNDDIKEINIKIPGQILDYVDTKEHLLELYNYITNLQHTKEYLGEVLYEKDKELEKLNNKIKHYEETTTFGDYIKEVNLLVDYKSRIEKAVEYIKEDMYSEPNELYGLIDGEHLLNILNGRSDK